ncbi:MAG: hypothetical protein HKN24_14480 [Acidimicrobiales bacterium]|nr:hypothetical protein [Acidimicrobiales bacterium]
MSGRQPTQSGPVQSTDERDQTGEPALLVWLSRAALGAAIVGVFGGLLPGLAGQGAGDTDSLAFRIGVPLALIGAAIAIMLGAVLAIVLAEGSKPRNTSLASVAVGAFALFLTGALLFSG